MPLFSFLKLPLLSSEKPSMKILLLTTLLSVTSFTYAQCSGRVDNKNVMMFMDMNNSALEIAAAQRAACARRQKLQVIPRSHQQYNQLTNVVQNDMKAFEHCFGTGGNCDRQEATYMASSQRLETFKATLPSAREQLKTELERLKAAGGKLANFIISGHDGGGTYSGHKGEISRGDIGEVLSQFPEVNNVKSVMLLGCYTAVPNEVIHWKQTFPNAKLIAGYDGIAPASDKLAGHQYLEDLLRREPTILAQADQSRLNTFLRTNIRGLSLMNVGVYVELECVGPNKLYYGLDNQSRVIRPLDIRECEGKEELVGKIGADITRYYEGESEPPTDTTNGELRKIYNQGRRYEHCGANLNREYSMEQAFNLLFYNGIKNNFARYYANDLARAGEMIGTITAEELTQPYIEAVNLLEDNIVTQEELVKLSENKEEYLAYLARKQVEIETQKTSLAVGIQDVINGTKLPATIDEVNKLQAYQTLSEKGNTYAFYAEAMNARPEEMKAFHEQTVARLRQQQNSYRINMANLTANPDAFNVWIPNAQNLASHSRKETLENIHKMETIKLMPGLSMRKLTALSWLQQVTSYHLQTMENPFSWHEYTGRMPEKPLGADNLNLDSWMKMAGEAP